MTSCSSEPCHFSWLRRLCASASAPSRPSNFSRSARLALRKVCVAIDCMIASVFLTRWLSSSISRPCSISPRAIAVAIRTAKARPTDQQDRADHAGDRKIAPQRRDQRAFRDARGDGPAGKRGTRDTGDQRHALERHGGEGGFGLAEHLRIERGRGAFADRLLRVRHAGEIDAFAVEDRDRPVLAGPLLFDHGLKDLDRRAERNDVEHLAVANDGYLDRHDQPSF